MNKSAFVFLITIVACGCTRGFSGKLIERCATICDQDTRSIPTLALRDVTDFAWTRMYIFPDWTTTDSITRLTGIKYDKDDVPDDYKRIIFFNGDKEVYEEDFKPFDYNHSTIDFQNTETATCFTPSKSLFRVEKSHIANSCKGCFLYSLTQVGN